MDYPIIPKELLDRLKKDYPDRAPSLSTPDRQVWFDAGKAALIRDLQELYDQQQETILGG